MDQKPAWAEIVVTVEKKHAEAVANFLIEQGSTGIAEENLRLQRESPVAVLKAYLGSDGPVTAVVDSLKQYLRSLYELAGSLPAAPPDITVNSIPDEDWNKKWKSFFQPVKVTGRIVIKPSWQNYWKRDGEVIVELDPGMAFGTGTHPSTRLCLKAIDKLAQESAAHSLEGLLDVGTGSGILALAGALLGFQRVVGIDVDNTAVACACRNADNNRVVDRIAFSTTPVRDIQGVFSVVVANILPHTLIHIRQHLVPRVDDKGYLILSGILNDKAQEVIAAFSQDVAFIEKILEEEWVCLVFQKK
jgi:ribosomal protein L11 methyltransferase